MSQDKDHPLIRRIRDRSLNDADRVAAIEQVGILGLSESIEMLIEIATTASEPKPLQTAAGAALARLFHRKERLYEAPLHDLTDDAYLAFDITVAEIQKGASP